MGSMLAPSSQAPRLGETQEIQGRAWSGPSEEATVAGGGQWCWSDLGELAKGRGPLPTLVRARGPGLGLWWRGRRVPTVQCLRVRGQWARLCVLRASWAPSMLGRGLLVPGARVPGIWWGRKGAHWADWKGAGRGGRRGKCPEVSLGPGSLRGRLGA